MDLFGKKAEDAVEAVRNVSERVEKLESHLNAVDSAVQDIAEDSGALAEGEIQELERLQSFGEESDRNRKKIEELEQAIRELRKGQRENSMKVEKVMDSKLMDSLEATSKSVKRTAENTRRIRSDLSELEDRVDELEDQLYLEINKRDFDFRKKLNKRRYEEDKDSFKNELKKLRASINFLADEIDSQDGLEID